MKISVSTGGDMARLIVLTALFVTPTLADIMVINMTNNRTVDYFPDLPAAFGHSIPPPGILGFVATGTPNDTTITSEACEKGSIDPPERFPNPTRHWIVLVKKGGCTYKKKIQVAQEAGYDAVIVHNVHSNVLEQMICEGFGCSDLIPSVFIGQEDAFFLSNRYLKKSYMVYISNERPFYLTKYLLPMAIVVGVGFVVILVYMIVRCIKDARRARRHRLPSRSLKKIPMIKYKKGDPYDTCAICLEDYNEGEKLRVLPCSHAFHSKCVDPWLTKTKRVCPCCKRKVFTRDENPHPDSGSSSEDERETAPLLGSARGTRQTDGGTFTSYIHPLQSHSSSISSSSSSSSSSPPSSTPVLTHAHQDSLCPLDESGVSSSEHSINGDQEDEAVEIEDPVMHVDIVRGDTDATSSSGPTSPSRDVVL
ncbi:unnamed protein product [Darwinula stevensoni]|uniref:RING-type E3 ubiquitin transferase n=1 Tax=Darwinula stevensoni TaxID=69355 RepID=A0A7R9A671_9CRUS|nr:unnamed protein product [Darwinula stevensoni]CAG0893573.1 unnamed protein product [Darwinula stevensoni]